MYECVSVCLCDRMSYSAHTTTTTKIPERQCVDMSTLLPCNSHYFFLFTVPGIFIYICLFFLFCCHVVNQIDIGGICKNTYCGNWMKFRNNTKIFAIYTCLCLSAYMYPCVLQIVYFIISFLFFLFLFANVVCLSPFHLVCVYLSDCLRICRCENEATQTKTAAAKKKCNINVSFVVVVAPICVFDAN